MTSITYDHNITATVGPAIDNRSGPLVYDVVTIAKSAVITSWETGIVMDSGQTLYVHGRVDGINSGIELGPTYSSNTRDIGVVNISKTGSVESQSFGIEIHGASNIIRNKGRIDGHSWAIFIEPFNDIHTDRRHPLALQKSLVVNDGVMLGSYGAISTAGETTIVNRGLIDGGRTSIVGGDDRDIVSNGGAIKGGVFLNGGNDVFNSATGRLFGGVSGGNGNDKIAGGITADVLRGDDGNDKLYGNGRNDTLYGGMANDALDGGQGNDNLLGGSGRDRLTGGAGSDCFTFSAGVNAANRDVVTDFSRLQHDRIQIENEHAEDLPTGHLSSSAFYVGSAAHDKDDRIIYDANRGALYYDRDGTGAAAPVLMAIFTSHPMLNVHDFLVV